MKTKRYHRFTSPYSRWLLIAGGTGLVFWLLWLLLAALYWVTWAEHGAAFAGIWPWSFSVLAVMLLVFLGGVLYDHSHSLHHAIGEDQAVVVKHLTPRGIERGETLYQGQHELPFTAWIGSRISLQPFSCPANEVVVWIEGHPARLQAQVVLHIIDPATYERAPVALQAIFARALGHEVLHFSCQEVVNQPHRLNAAVLLALNTELLICGLRADSYTTTKLCWVESGQKYDLAAVLPQV